MADKIVTEFFETDGKSLYSWKRKAQSLKKAADIIWEDFIKYIRLGEGKDAKTRYRLALVNLDIAEVSLMIYGLAIENLVKGIIISENPELIKNGKIDKCLISHNLSKLLSEVNVTLKKGKIIRSRKTTISEIWRMKYPGLNKNEDIIIDEKEMILILEDHIKWKSKYPISKNSNQYTITGLQPNFKIIIDRIYNKLMNMINSKLEENNKCLPV